MKPLHVVLCWLFLVGIAAAGCRKAGPSTESSSGSRASEAKSSVLVGTWYGTLQATPLIELRLGLEVTQHGNSLEGALISLDQGGARIPLSVIAEKQGAVRFESKRIGGAFAGTLTAGASELQGEWTQGALVRPVTFKRTAKLVSLNRPQEPRKPYPYTERQVNVKNRGAGVMLSGTLTLPSTPGPHPAVVLITGSGPQDRDESLLGHRPFLVLADHLTRNGIAVLRYDDRGYGKSTGNFGTALDSDFADDALAAVEYLTTRKDIDVRQIGLVGHSEGGIVAPRAAVKSDKVAFIVMLAGVGVPMDQLLLRQARDIAQVAGATPAALDLNAALQRRLFEVVRTSNDPAATAAKVEKIIADELAKLPLDQRKAVAAAQLTDARMVATPWARDLLRYDPAATLRQVKCPVLALCGDKDLQVAAKENLAAIREALASGGNNRATIEQLPGLNHLFQHCETGSPSEYGRIEETFSPDALDLVASWIRRTTARTE